MINFVSLVRSPVLIIAANCGPLPTGLRQGISQPLNQQLLRPVSFFGSPECTDLIAIACERVASYYAVGSITYYTSWLKPEGPVSTEYECTGSGVQLNPGAG